MPTWDTSCFYSSVKNSSGARRRFGFLPPHGRELAADEEVVFWGDIRQNIQHLRGPEIASARRDILAFDAAVSRGDIIVIYTPTPIFQDQTTNDTKVLQLDDGTLSVVDPCWETSVS